MKDKKKTKGQLIDELQAARERLRELEEAHLVTPAAKEETDGSEAMIRTFTESCPEYLVLLNPEAHILFVNRNLPQLSSEMSEGTSIYDYLPVDCHPAAAECFARVCESRETGCFEFNCSAPQGEVLSLQARVVPVLRNDDVIAVAMIATDVSERLRLERRVGQLEVELRSLCSHMTWAEEARGRRLAAELVERISESLSQCKSKVLALRQSLSYTSWAAALDEVSTHMDRTIQETQTLLDLEAVPSLLHTQGLEKAIQWLAEGMEQQHGLRCVVKDHGQRHPKPLEGDTALQLYQVVRELLGNVIRHAKAKQARITLSRERDSIAIRVEDDGVGFDPTAAEAPSPQSEGLELASRRSGYPTIRKKLELLGGSLEVSSRPGKGTQVALRAPLKTNKKFETVAS